MKNDITNENFALLLGDSALRMQELESDIIDLAITSPPYDDLRTYEGFTFDFSTIARELFRVLKPGGTLVWIVGDATIKGSETGTSFKQVLSFMKYGFNLHDTMIWNKGGFSAVGALKSRYAPVFEYMFVLTKGKIKTFNPIKDRPNKWAGGTVHGTVRNADGTFVKVSGNNKKILGEFGQRFNIWEIGPVRQRGVDKHPAPFPLSLAKDHIISWSNPGDLILDPFLGSGTTGIAALHESRKFIGIEISEKYFDMAYKKISVGEE